MAVSNILKNVVSGKLDALKFKKKSDSWYLRSDETILIVNLQKSQYGQQYYINFAVTFRSICDEEFPKEHQGDIRFRLSSIVPDQFRDECELILDLEYGEISDEEREKKLQEFFESYGLALLMRCSSVSGAAKALEKGQLPMWTVSKKAVELLTL